MYQLPRMNGCIWLNDCPDPVVFTFKLGTERPVKAPILLIDIPVPELTFVNDIPVVAEAVFDTADNPLPPTCTPLPPDTMNCPLDAA